MLFSDLGFIPLLEEPIVVPQKSEGVKIYYRSDVQRWLVDADIKEGGGLSGQNEATSITWDETGSSDASTAEAPERVL